MKKLIIILFIATLIGCEKKYSANIVHITDGDTFWLANGKKLRLAYVDCPESHQAYGQEAKQFTQDHILNKEVQLKEICKDKYGRYVATVLVDGQDLAEMLLDAGLAVAYKKYSTPSLFAKYEDARQKHKGLFASNYILPYQFRKQNKK